MFVVRLTLFVLCATYMNTRGEYFNTKAKPVLPAPGTASHDLGSAPAPLLLRDVSLWFVSSSNGVSTWLNLQLVVFDISVRKRFLAYSTLSREAKRQVNI